MAILAQSLVASVPARRQGFARFARRLTSPLTAAGAPAQMAVSSCLTQLLRSLTTGSDTKFLTTPRTTQRQRRFHCRSHPRMALLLDQVQHLNHLARAARFAMPANQSFQQLVVTLRP